MTFFVFPQTSLFQAVEEEAGVATSGSIPANDVETVDHSSTQNAENVIFISFYISNLVTQLL